jgi:nucleoside-diphosphate-sugar epimerase
MLLTGATGFVGEALLERVLSDLPDTRVVLLVRSRPGSTAQQRVEHLLTKPAFGPLRERVGDDGMAALLADRITVLDGDLATWPALPDDLDVVIHCAGEVSFDPPIDEAFATNTHGIANLLAAVEKSGSRPHVVHVSTAYVNGLRKGPVAAGRLEHDIDWRTEAAAAARLRDRTEDASRTSAQLLEFLEQAREEHGREGPQVVSKDADRRRREWVHDQLVDAGRERALSLGFTDGYTYTKAMGERVVEELAGDLPVTIARPSIIESALAKPFPGWIEGYKMADPIILAYGRGALPSSPRCPTASSTSCRSTSSSPGTLARPRTRRRPGHQRYLHLSTSARNPLLFADLYRIVREYFQRHPLEQRDRGTFAVPGVGLPGSDRLERRLRAGEKAIDVADKVLTSLPRGRKVRSAALKLDRQRAQLDFLRRYFDIYRAYTVAEVTYLDPETAALHDLLPEHERELFGFDPTQFDWDHYLGHVHCTSITGLVRTITATKKGPRDRVDADLPGHATAAGRSSRCSTWTARCCPRTSSSPTCGCAWPG